MSKKTILPAPTISIKVTEEEKLLLHVYRQQREDSIMTIPERVHDLSQMYYELTLLDKDNHFTTYGKTILWEWYYINFFILNGGHR